MFSKSSKISRGLVIVCFMHCIVAANAQASESNIKESRVISLPSDIAQELRDHNSPGERGFCHESNIFVHGFHYFDGPDYRLIWFLGAPDYLCKTNSFISVIVDSSGNWTVGKTLDKGWLGSDMLSGVPVLFQHVDNLGFFLTSEWQVEAAGNYMYYSADGETWTSVELPAPTRKSPDYDCCDAPTIGSLCIADSGKAYISYEDSRLFDGSTWASSIDKTFPQTVNWSRAPRAPEDAHCDRLWPQDFIPHSLREKTNEGALFDVLYDWAVLIPGPTK